MSRQRRRPGERNGQQGVEVYDAIIVESYDAIVVESRIDLEQIFITMFVNQLEAQTIRQQTPQHPPAPIYQLKSGHWVDHEAYYKGAECNAMIMVFEPLPT